MSDRGENYVRESRGSKEAIMYHFQMNLSNWREGGRFPYTSWWIANPTHIAYHLCPLPINRMARLQSTLPQSRAMLLSFRC